MLFPIYFQNQETENPKEIDPDPFYIEPDDRPDSPAEDALQDVKTAEDIEDEVYPPEAADADELKPDE